MPPRLFHVGVELATVVSHMTNLFRFVRALQAAFFGRSKSRPLVVTPTNEGGLGSCKKAAVQV